MVVAGDDAGALSEAAPSIRLGRPPRRNWPRLEGGAPIKAAQEALGHTDPATTLRIYAHVTERMRQQQAEVIDGAFDVSAEKPGKGSDLAALP